MTALAESAADDILGRARDGDHDAFAALIEEFQSTVYGIAFHFFADRAIAEELAQDVFLQLYRSLSAIQSRTHLAHWLRQVASRKCIDAVRKRAPRRESLDDVELSVPPNTPDPFLTRRLQKRVAKLPDLQRLILTLRYQEDLGPSEIGRTLGMPENTVKSYLHRALTALRKEFA
ncbi:MAG TPA: RNA polymerase sigma factor [Thermoanaerobaculia bacterium]|nr:RNA polymerase sigma factor [Thermoanaerobaculia bacterium]